MGAYTAVTSSTACSINAQDWSKYTLNVTYYAPKPPEGALEWLDRRVNEMRVKL